MRCFNQLRGFNQLGERGRGASGSGGPAFNPADLSGLRLWLKADALALTDGDAVTTWPDSSGLGHDATQATAANKPTFKTNIRNGKPVVRADGMNDTLSLPAWSSLISASAYSLVLVVKASSVSTNSTGGGYYLNSAALMDSLGYLGVCFRSIGSVGVFHYDGAARIVETAYTIGEFILVEVVFSGTSIDLTVNGASSVLSGVGAVGSIGGTVMPYGSPGLSLLTGDVAEILIANVAWSNPERASLRAHLNQKYGF